MVSYKKSSSADVGPLDYLSNCKHGLDLKRWFKLKGQAVANILEHC